MKITVTVDLSVADRRTLQRQWGLRRLPSKAELERWVADLPQTALVDYRNPEEED